MSVQENDRGSRIIVALDFGTATEALGFVHKLEPGVCRLKVGKELFTAAGPAVVESLIKRGFDVFLDMKYHDIPNTVARACRAAASLGVWMLNVHVLGGRRMLEAAREALGNREPRPLLIGVTLLTSMQADDLQELGINHSPALLVDRLADLAQAADLDGVVCSPKEAERIRRRYGAGFKLVTPGIRPFGTAADDQRRVASIREALCAGADFLVIGRPVTQSKNPCQTLLTIKEELSDLNPTDSFR
jgi:orotidine-5'-phosphate decarboxylase